MALRLGNLTFDGVNPDVLAAFRSEAMGDWRPVTAPSGNEFCVGVELGDET